MVGNEAVWILGVWRLKFYRGGGSGVLWSGFINMELEDCRSGIRFWGLWFIVWASEVGVLAVDLNIMFEVLEFGVRILYYDVWSSKFEVLAFVKSFVDWSLKCNVRSVDFRVSSLAFMQPNEVRDIKWEKTRLNSGCVEVKVLSWGNVWCNVMR